MTTTVNDPTADTGAYALTTQDIKALRTCDRIGYTYNRAASQSRLDAVKDADARNPWEQRHVIAVATRTESYQEGCRVKSASQVLYRYAWDTNPVNTFLSLLAAGDTISAHVIAHNNNGYLNDAGLHCDHLRLCIHRGKKTLVFLVEVSVCPDNSARMCTMERAQ